MLHYDERWKSYVLSVYDEIDERVGEFMREVYWALRMHSGVLERGNEEKRNDAVERLLKITEMIGWENMEKVLFLIDDIVREYDIGAVEVALNRELHLRERVVKKGGRPSIVKKYCEQIDEIYSGRYGNPFVSRGMNLKLRIEQIKQLLKDVREKHSKATYLKVRRCALEKINELEWELKLYQEKTPEKVRVGSQI